jgi:hypothetical protein
MRAMPGTGSDAVGAVFVSWAYVPYSCTANRVDLPRVTVLTLFYACRDPRASFFLRRARHRSLRGWQAGLGVSAQGCVLRGGTRYGKRWCGLEGKAFRCLGLKVDCAAQSAGREMWF